MKLDTHVDIVYNASTKRHASKATFSQISCVKDNSNKNILIINSSSKALTTKYSITNNIVKVFCKFVEEGKATIQLKEPNITICLQKANPTQLKTFLKSLQLALQNKLDEVNKPLNQAASNSVLNKLQQEQPIIKKPKTSMTIRQPSDYIEFLRGYKSPQYNFSENLQKLEIINCNMYSNQLNKHLYQYFKQLTYLNLEANNLKFEINHLNVPSLKELYLSRNEIESFNNETCYMPNLVYLKLSQNKFSKITNKFCSLFQNLKVLHLDDNQIICLNNRFGYYLKWLKTLNLRGNLLKHLPYSITNLRLDMLELDNKGFDGEQVFIDHNENLKHNLFPKLVELTARVIMNSKISFKHDNIPAILKEYITGAIICLCGKACINYSFKHICLLAIPKISQAYSFVSFGDQTNMVPILVYYCSIKCYNNGIRKNPQIIW